MNRQPQHLRTCKEYQLQSTSGYYDWPLLRQSKDKSMSALFTNLRTSCEHNYKMLTVLSTDVLTCQLQQETLAAAQFLIHSGH